MVGAFLKKKYSMSQLYSAILNSYLAMPAMIRNRRNKTVSPQFLERLMLAATEVNGCEVCSYAHTKMALKEGFSQDEINAFLLGSKAYVLEEEATALLYAQHVADTMGNPDPETDKRLADVYGSEKAATIKAGIALIMMGNTAGIPLSAFVRRLKGTPYTNSSLTYELGMLLVQPPFMVAALLHALAVTIFGVQA